VETAYASAYPALYAHHWWWRVREEILLGRIRRLLGSRDDARILDVGCGSGLFFDVLQPFGHVEGLETDEDAVTRAGRWQRQITNGRLDSSFTPSLPFDLVLLLDVLEHVEEPEAVLRRALEILRPGGAVLVTVPAFQWLWTTHDDLNHHKRRYTARDLRVSLEQSGFVAIDTRYLFQSIVVPKLLTRMYERVSGASPRVPRVPARAVNSACRAWYRFEHAAFGWLPFGGSILAHAKREREE
jgi:2-polyprenyl-3-methyl-5-hydroxy-6-metoxy-1,4-benzoquinol methylase